MKQNSNIRRLWLSLMDLLGISGGVFDQEKWNQYNIYAVIVITIGSIIYAVVVFSGGG